MSAPDYYESDSPCRRCNGTLRYKNTKHKGKCVSCTGDLDADEWARGWVEDTRKADSDIGDDVYDDRDDIEKILGGPLK